MARGPPRRQVGPTPCTAPRARIWCRWRIGTGRRPVDRRQVVGSGVDSRIWEALALNANTLSRIPFRVRDELMIISMARWMRFIGIVQVLGGLIAGFFLLVGLIYVGA